MEIKLGRNTSLNHVVVDDGQKKISGEHCTIKKLPNGTFLLTDSSSNGTFINDRQVRQEPIKESDSLSLYKTRIDVKRILALFNSNQIKIGVPYSSLPEIKEKFTEQEKHKIQVGFKRLEIVYNDYQNQKTKISKDFSKKSNIMRGLFIGVGAIIGVLLTITSYLTHEQLYGIFAGVVSSTAMVLSFVMTPSQIDLQEKQNKLQEKFIDEWKCPNNLCGQSLPTTMGNMYKNLVNQKKCGKCQAPWVKES